MQDVFGTTGGLETYEFAGKTDRRIVRDLMLAEGWAAEEIRLRQADLDERMAAAGRELFNPQTVWACPGVPALLDALNRRPDVALAILTGNIQTTAPLKLAAAGIDPALFVAGAYGSDSLERDDLFAIALERVRESTGWQFSAEDVVTVGDTPADIQCARAGRGRAIAVATGPYSAEVLSRHQPDHLFNDLANTEEVLHALVSSTRQNEWRDV
jgi:phosphoglycolate phosphatase-like HAD superfamily hydrolase